MAKWLLYKDWRGMVHVAFRDFKGRRYYRTYTREQYENLYGGREGYPSYEDLPVKPRSRRRV